MQATGDRSHSVHWRPPSGGGMWKPVVEDPASQVGDPLHSGAVAVESLAFSNHPGGRQVTGGARELWSSKNAI